MLGPTANFEVIRRLGSLFDDASASEHHEEC